MTWYANGDRLPKTFEYNALALSPGVGMVIFKKFSRSGKIQGNFRNVYVKSRKIEIKVLRTFIFLSLFV